VSVFQGDIETFSVGALFKATVNIVLEDDVENFGGWWVLLVFSITQKKYSVNTKQIQDIRIKMISEFYHYPFFII
jgi:hypothetical protein